MTRPFQNMIATNETSETMQDVLSWYDDWFNEIASNEDWTFNEDDVYDELISDEI